MANLKQWKQFERKFNAMVNFANTRKQVVLEDGCLNMEIKKLYMLGSSTIVIETEMFGKKGNYELEMEDFNKTYKINIDRKYGMICLYWL